ncbi:HAD-IIIA family hydrolase [Peribacillus kribbensis]|uniref:HAD-IIIA family hydrolase n=1 Tax=Peribacillus kribbensis TaxID=356658 RepID=UPI000416A33B|nr:HAD-IIIA family hydrolase [Peribacillus kribbensis]
MKDIQAVFIDRDGTIGGGDGVIYPGKFRLFPFTSYVMQELKQRGLLLLSFTNQPGISRGEASSRDFEKELLKFGFDDVYICPHDPEDGCACRKPQVGMLKEAAQKHRLNLGNCVVIGDRWKDMEAAGQAGCLKILVLTGAGNEAYKRYVNEESSGAAQPDYIAEDLTQALEFLEEIMDS